MEEHQERLKELENNFMKIVQEIDKSHLRKMQGDMHRCAANCCDNGSYSMERNQNCIENCNKALENAQHYVQSEIDRLQNRWSRCLMECNDRVRDGLVPGESSKKLEKDFGDCATRCIDAQSNLMHTVQANIKRVLANGEYDRKA